METDFVCLSLFLFTPGIGAVSLFNFPECSDCSSREDVPCQIERIDNHCYHTEFRDKWPGQPQDLKAMEIEMENSRTAASFTWKPPYDASVESLNGFFLTVNILLPHGMGILGPFCFHANLSGTDWSAVIDPHSVVFHFDCVTTTMNKEMHVRLDVSSSPMPNKKPRFVESQAIIGRYTRPEMEGLKVNYTVTGTRVSVKFGPLFPEVKYHLVCLSPCSSDFSQCFDQKNISEFGLQTVIFDGVKPDNYSIMINRNIESKYYVTKCFPVVAPSPSVENSPLVLSIIILGCLLFVVIATTMMFFFFRRRRRCLPGCMEVPKMDIQYEQTSQTVPNNTNDETEATAHEAQVSNSRAIMALLLGTVDHVISLTLYNTIPTDMAFENSEGKEENADSQQELWFLFSTTHKSFVSVVEKLANIVTKWTSSRVDIKSTICKTEMDIDRKFKQFKNQKIVIILCDDTKCLLENLHCEANLPNPTSVKQIQDRFLLKMFHTLFRSRQQVQCMVSICSVVFVSKVFEDLKTFLLVKSEKGIDNLEVDGRELQGFFNSLHPTFKRMPEDMSKVPEISEFLCSVKTYMKECKSSLLDLGYFSSCQDGCQPNTQHQNALPYRQDRLKREENTKQWVKSQNMQRKFVQPQQLLHPAATGHYKSGPYFDNNNYSHQRLKVGGSNPWPYCTNPAGSFDQGQRLSLHVNRKSQQQDIDWEAPDSDNESVAMSALIKQAMEMNQNYMENTKE